MSVYLFDMASLKAECMQKQFYLSAPLAELVGEPMVC